MSNLFRNLQRNLKKKNGRENKFGLIIDPQTSNRI